MKALRSRPLLALALAVPLLLAGCSSASESDTGTTSEGNTDNQVDQPPLPDEVTDAPTPGDDASSPS